MTYFKTMTDFEIVKEIDLVLEGRGMRVDVSAYGPPLEETMSKEAIELWKSLDCEGNDNISQIHAITSSDAPKSVQDELINFFLGCRKDMAEDKVYAYKTIAEWWMEYKSEDSGCNAEEVKPPAVASANPDTQDAAPKDAAKKAAKDAEWMCLLKEMAADARNPMIKADVCVRWREAKLKIGTRLTKEMKRETFNDVLNFVNKHRNPGDPIDWTPEAAEKWADRHPDMIKKFLDNPDL